MPAHNINLNAFSQDGRTLEAGSVPVGSQCRRPLEGDTSLVGTIRSIAAAGLKESNGQPGYWTGSSTLMATRWPSLRCGVGPKRDLRRVPPFRTTVTS